MAQKFKKIIKDPKPKLRQVALIVSQYLKDINFVDMSPVDIMKNATREEIIHNYMLARCYYGYRFNVRFNKEGMKKPVRPRSPWWIDYDWKLFSWDKLKHEWVEVDSPMYPGTRNIFEDEDQIKPTTESLYEKIQELEKPKKDEDKPLTVEDLERIDKFKENY